jgi:mRNA interferase MazF
VKRGEIWWAELPPPVGNRPVVILTRDAVLSTIGAVVVALVTRTLRQPEPVNESETLRRRN